MLALDEIDYGIIEILKKDARMPFTEVASRLGVSDSTIHVRLKKLRDDGIIRGFTVDVNEELLGKKIHGLVMVNVNPSCLEQVISQLMKAKSVLQVYETHSTNDLVVLIYAYDLDELRQVLLDIRKIENIVSTSLTTILKAWKYAHIIN